MSPPKAPGSVLIIGSGVFGLSTALHLSLRPAFHNTLITVLDRAVFPAADGSSVDTSRIVRADYSDAAYAQLAAEAQRVWRGQVTDDVYGGRLGADGRYRETGLVMVSDAGEVGYVEQSMHTVSRILRDSGENPAAIQPLHSPADIANVYRAGGGTSGSCGYVNWASGWANAEESLTYVRRLAEERPNLSFMVGEVVALVETPDGTVTGVTLDDGRKLEADLTVLATGAWSPGLVDLQGRAVATGQALAYIDITPQEQAELEKNPILFNFSSGCFIITPSNGHLKIARHHMGYVNPVTRKDAQGNLRTVSVPKTAVTNPGMWIPREAEDALRMALKQMVPALSHRPFSRTKMCWYTDTPKGDFIVDYHPNKKGLFLATGGSGHGFKFLPVIGEEIADILEKKPEARFREKWAWPQQTVAEVMTQDGSRAGAWLLILDETVGPAPLPKL